MNIVEFLSSKNLKLATAESCTGGMIASAITDIAGSSDAFDRGFVTYSNQAKIDMLGVSQKTLDEFGAVSEQTCREMVLGALKNSQANIAIATTGIAGPSGDSAEKPVGLVYIGVGTSERVRVIKFHFSGTRAEVRKQTVERGLELILPSL
jgi:PncC family amidohydrolase